MNESLSITNLEAERQRRQIEHIARLARMGGTLPVAEVDIHMRGTDVNLGGVKFALEWNNIDGGAKALDLYISNEEVEEKLYAIFQDKIVTKKFYEHIFTALAAEMKRKYNGTVTRYGDTNFCG